MQATFVELPPFERTRKDQADDLTQAQRKVLKQLLKTELENRQPKDGERDDK
jgi:hypothetical protein